MEHNRYGFTVKTHGFIVNPQVTWSSQEKSMGVSIFLIIVTGS